MYIDVYLPFPPIEPAGQEDDKAAERHHQQPNQRTNHTPEYTPSQPIIRTNYTLRKHNQKNNVGIS